MKTCKKCGVEKPFSQYTKDKHRPDGRDSRCRKCKKVAIAGWKKQDTKARKLARAQKKGLRLVLKSNGQKICAHCGEVKSLDSFYLSTKRGLFSECKQCAAKKAKSPKWRKSASDCRLRSKYGLLREDFDQILLNQQNKCKICGEEFLKTPNIDHCHKTGTLRGLLCRQCNQGLGLFKDSPNILISAAAYLQGAP